MNQLPAVSLLILAHIVADFLLQTEKIANQKDNINHLFQHGLAVGVVSILFTSFYLSARLLIIIAVITLLHMLIDWGKQVIIIKNSKLHKSVTLFITDQLLHLATITGGYIWLKDLPLQPWGQHLNNLAAKLFPFLNNLASEDWTLIFLLTAAYIFNWRAGSFMVEKTLAEFLSLSEAGAKQKKIGFNNNDEGQLNINANIGALIGKLERTVILTLVLAKSFTAISLVFAAKSVARFSNFKSKKFVDYYIVGTFSSLIISLAIGVVLNIIISYYPGTFILHQLFGQ